MAYKIYTKTGDKGQTSLIGGERVSKNNLRIECYGATDELSSYLGMVSDLANTPTLTLLIKEIQDRIFTIGSELATPPHNTVHVSLPDLHLSDIDFLEKEIDKMEKELPPLQSFILAGGHLASSTCHVARCVCRRAERLCVALHQEGHPLPELLLPYLNRLSDCLFVLARYLNHLHHIPDTPWIPRK